MDTTVSTVVNEVRITGRVYRRLIDKAAKLWQRISYWTHASDVEFDDGKTAQEKVGNINGITSDFKYGADDIAASSVLTKTIKDDLNDGIINERIQLVIDEDGNLGWKKDGADTVIPFKGGKVRFTVNASSAAGYGSVSGGMTNAIVIEVDFKNETITKISSNDSSWNVIGKHENGASLIMHLSSSISDVSFT